MSDGSDALTVRAPESFAVARTVKVTRGGRPLDRLNELECVGGDVYANVWMTDTIVRIDMKTGQVTATMDASGLLTPAERLGTDVLNGIAYDPADQTFLITGKLWPKLFRVKFVA
jgi:glutamine cyclotransferase